MSAEQTSVSPCCVTGHIHEGSPLGSFEILHGVRTYVSDPKPVSGGANAKQNVVVLIPDIFGVDLVNSKLQADSWAQDGWKVLLPDVLEGDAIDHSLLKAIVPNLRDQEKATVASKAADGARMAAALGPWLVKHREAVVKPIIEGFVKAVKAEPTTGKVAAVGNCWGGRYAFLLAQADSPAKVDVAVANHPSFLVMDDVKPITSTPVAIFKGDKDAMMSEEQLDEVEAALKEQLGSKFLVKRYPNAVHGFTVRGDDMIPEEKKQKEDAANEGIKFVKQYFDA